MFNDTMKTIKITAPCNTAAWAEPCPPKFLAMVESQLSIAPAAVVGGKVVAYLGAMAVSRA
jgi:hypothetical protein